MITLLIIFAFVATGLSIWLVALTSPAGYEDESGFHFGVEQKVLQKTTRRSTTRKRVSSKVTSKKTVERKNSHRTRRADAAWKTPDPLADQMKFPFPVTH